MSTYNVVFYVYSDISVTVEAENEEEALKKAIDESIDNEPLVSWTYDDNTEPIIEKID